MKDLSHIGPPGTDEERRIASARRRDMPLRFGASEWKREEPKIISGPAGPRKSLKTLETAKENPRKTKRFLGLSLPGLGPIWLDLAGFG
jgi:hypothetical protein